MYPMAGWTPGTSSSFGFGFGLVINSAAGCRVTPSLHAGPDALDACWAHMSVTAVDRRGLAWASAPQDLPARLTTGFASRARTRTQVRSRQSRLQFRADSRGVQRGKQKEASARNGNSSPPVRTHARRWAVAAAASAMGASCFGEALGATESPRLPCVCTRAAPARWSRRGGEVEPQGHRCRWSLYDPVNALAMLGAEGKAPPSSHVVPH